MIWSTSYHHVTVLVYRSWPHLLFTVASVHRHQVFLKLHRHTRSLASKPPTCPSLLATGPSSQASSWSSPPWSHDSMSCLICNELLHHHIITCGLISCVSHINTISPPKLSLNYQNQTRTFQWCSSITSSSALAPRGRIRQWRGWIQQATATATTTHGWACQAGPWIFLFFIWLTEAGNKTSKKISSFTVTFHPRRFSLPDSVNPKCPSKNIFCSSEIHFIYLTYRVGSLRG